MSSSTSRVVPVAAWIGTAAGAGAIGAIVGGAVETAFTADGFTEAVGTIGYSAMFAWPILTALVVIARGLWAAWRPAELAAALTDEHGSAPRLAGWIGYILVACVIGSWATFNAVRVLAAWTTFKPTVIALAIPPVVVAVALILIATSRPGADAFTALARRLDRTCRSRLGRTPFTPKVILLGAAVTLVAVIALTWRFSVSPRIGYLDLSILIHPAVAIASAAAVHAGLARCPTRLRRVTLATGATLGVISIGFAGWLRGAQPLAVLQIWGRPTIASEVIERLYYLEDLRDDITVLVEPPAVRPGAVPRDIVLITIDTLRADRTPVGGGRAEMPHLAKLGADGAVFAAAFSPGNVTRRAVTSISSGVAPTRMRGKVAGWALRLDPRHVLLAERFRAAGYDTAGFFCCASFWSPRHRLGINRGIDHLVIEPDGAVLADTARAWIAERRATASRPLFVWIHFIEPHNWLQGRTDLRTPAERRAQYDRVLGEVDGYVGRVLGAFTGTGERAPIVAVTADHGEALGDHGQPYHSTDLYDSQIHVPLVFAGPGITPKHVVEPVGLIALAPTLLDLAGLVPPGMPQMDGESFAAVVLGTRAEDPQGGYAFSAMIQDRSAPVGSRAVIRGPWKLIETRRGFELYDRRADPTESRNLATSRPEKLAELRRLLDDRRALDGRSPFAAP
jgi:arylsulfatase A-like enzyme